jgi:hypothetical protein
LEHDGAAVAQRADLLLVRILDLLPINHHLAAAGQ